MTKIYHSKIWLRNCFVNKNKELHREQHDKEKCTKTQKHQLLHLGASCLETGRATISKPLICANDLCAKNLERSVN
jgi:hypothetical protein